MKFSMSEAWRDATTMLSSNREVLLIVAGIFFFIPSVLAALAMGDVEEQLLADPEHLQQAIFSFYSDWGWLLGLTSLASLVGNLALLALLRDYNRPTVGQAIVIGLTGLLPAIGAYFVLVFGLGLTAGVLIAAAGAAGNTAIAFLVGVIVFVGLIYVFVKVSLSAPVIAIEKVYNPFKILARSWRLTSGNSFRLFLFYLLLFIVYIVVAGIATAVVTGLLYAIAPSVAVTVNAILSSALSAIVYLVFVAVLAAVHRQLSGPSAAAVGETFE